MYIQRTDGLGIESVPVPVGYSPLANYSNHGPFKIRNNRSTYLAIGDSMDSLGYPKSDYYRSWKSDSASSPLPAFLGRRTTFCKMFFPFFFFRPAVLFFLFHCLWWPLLAKNALRLKRRNVSEIWYFSFVVMHLVSDWGPLHPLSFARTLLKMCNEPRTIDFQAQGLTGGEQHRNIFFFSFFFLHYTFLSLDLQYLRVLFLSRVFYSNLLHRVLLFFCLSRIGEKQLSCS